MRAKPSALQHPHKNVREENPYPFLSEAQDNRGESCLDLIAAWHNLPSQESWTAHAIPFPVATSKRVLTADTALILLLILEMCKSTCCRAPNERKTGSIRSFIEPSKSKTSDTVEANLIASQRSRLFAPDALSPGSLPPSK